MKQDLDTSSVLIGVAGICALLMAVLFIAVAVAG